MVPGMTERERLAVDLQRLAWLADARLGSASHVVARSNPGVAPGSGQARSSRISRASYTAIARWVHRASSRICWPAVEQRTADSPLPAYSPNAEV